MNKLLSTLVAVFIAGCAHISEKPAACQDLAAEFVATRGEFEIVQGKCVGSEKVWCLGYLDLARNKARLFFWGDAQEIVNDGFLSQLPVSGVCVSPSGSEAIYGTFVQQFGEPREDAAR